MVPTIFLDRGIRVQVVRSRVRPDRGSNDVPIQLDAERPYEGAASDQSLKRFRTRAVDSHPEQEGHSRIETECVCPYIHIVVNPVEVKGVSQWAGNPAGRPDQGSGIPVSGIVTGRISESLLESPISDKPAGVEGGNRGGGVRGRGCTR